ncbi:N-acetylmuramoyl-L-alanine amidase [Bacteroidia bacterium]|nr:N-acetylmuramoyl-L-alanine amidase [Bacteroidia bacterium]
MDYIETYKELAVKHQAKYKIPASITLSQGLLESGAGKSKFVRDTNNHFGIKCHSDWKGDRVYRADDGPNDCFRSYKTAEESFDDHSQFLQRNRYSPLFELEIKDYAAWAKGLQKCGYATDKAYANKLIKLIEDYELYRFDTKGKSKETFVSLKRTPYSDHGLIYVLGVNNDSYERVANDMGFNVKDLIKYNEVPEDFPVQKGNIIYLEKKNKKAEKTYTEHIVAVGESMYSISQMYGMQVKNLYKLNKKDFDYVPEEGDVLRLR